MITCLHSDFRLGGLEPGETKTIRGKIDLLANDVPALRERDHRDFPEPAALHQAGSIDDEDEASASAAVVH